VSGTAAGRVAARAAIPAELAGERFDVAAARLFPQHSRVRLQRWIRDGSLTLDGARARGSSRVAGGQLLAVDAAEEPGVDWASAQVVPFTVRFADAALVVVDKPAGVVVHPGAGNRDRTLVNGLLHAFPELAALPRAGIVHRLDKDTSGLLLVARDAQVLPRLVQAMSSREIRREYRVVVRGSPRQAFTVDAPIGRHPRARTRNAVRAGGRPAVTHFRVVAGNGGFALLAARLETGRTHQIRVHLAHAGLRVLGDAAYGVPAPDGLIARQALHAARLAFTHPLRSQLVRVRSDLPADMRTLCEALGLLRGSPAAAQDAAP
jgi:23S rRNA pseudouridine1911/1915/1917 synthase